MNNTSDAATITAQGNLLIVSAPSGAGKTSLVKAAERELNSLTVSISHTTRQARPGEENGIDYHFVSMEQFENMKAKDGFLEWAQVFDRYYGTAKSSVDQLLHSGSDVILEIDWQGAQQVRKLYPDSASIFILPPSLAALELRLRNRAQDSDETIKRRMQDALSEASHYAEYDYLIINDEFDQALHTFNCIVTALRCTMQKQLIAQQKTLKQLLD